MTAFPLRIESQSNSLFKMLLSLGQSKGLKKENLFIGCGAKVVNEWLQNHREKVTHLITTDKMLRLAEDLGHQRQSLDIGNSRQIQTLILSHDLFQQLDSLGTHHPLFVARTPTPKTWDVLQPSSEPEVLLPLSDPSNLGAALRVCVAFGVRKIVLLKESAHPFHPKAFRSGAGCQAELDFFAGPSIQDLPNTAGLVLAQKGGSIRGFSPTSPWRLLLGEEGRGIPDTLGDLWRHVGIPIQPQIESLNAASALAIALYQFTH